MNSGLPIEVEQMGKMAFIGHTIPFQWFHQLKYASGHVNLPAIIILAEICEWYRPRVVRDEFTGQVISIEKKFSGDKLQKDYSSFSSLGLTKKQAFDACHYLCELGLITLETRDVILDNRKFVNRLFIGINPRNIWAISSLRVTSIVSLPVREVEEVEEVEDERNPETKIGFHEIDVPKKPKEQKKKTTANRLSPDWEVPQDLILWCKTNYVGVSDTMIDFWREDFIDYWISSNSKSSVKRDWPAAFRTWIRRSVQWNGLPETAKLKEFEKKKVESGPTCRFCSLYSKNPQAYQPCKFHKIK